MTDDRYIGNCRLILGDMRTVLPTLQGVDAIVSDVPYGISYSQGDSSSRDRRGFGRGKSNGKNVIRGDNEPFDPTPLLKFPCILFGANHYNKRLPEGGSWHAWDKNCGKGPADDFADVEFIWTNFKHKSIVIRYLWKGVLRQQNDGSPRYHVSEKPVPVMEECLGLLPGTPRVICDPYMGSGSTALACIKAHKAFIGIEIDPAHFATACRRIEAAYRQTDLFREPPAPKPEQLVLA